MMDDIIELVKNATDMFEFKYSTVSKYYSSVREEFAEKNLPL